MDVVDVITQEFVVVDTPVETTVEVLDEGVVSVVEDALTILSEGIQGPVGPKGDPGGHTFERIAATALSGHRVVLIDSNGKANYASNTNVADATRIIGITTGAASADAPVTIQSFSELTEPSWNWAMNLPVYLGADGFLTQTPPSTPGATFSVVVGFPTSSTTLFINVREPIILTL